MLVLSLRIDAGFRLSHRRRPFDKLPASPETMGLRRASRAGSERSEGSHFFIQHSLLDIRYSHGHCERSAAISKYLAPRPVLLAHRLVLRSFSEDGSFCEGGSKVEGFTWAFALSQSVICTMQYEKKSGAYAKSIGIGPQIDVLVCDQQHSLLITQPCICNLRLQS